MRELKFRGWDGEKMRYDVTGFEHGFKNEMRGIFFDGEYWSLAEDSITSKLDNRFAIAMQSTGLADKNGKDIYEGDVVKCDGGEMGRIYYDEASFYFKSKSISLLTGTIADICIVVGNIYETPELL